MITPAESTNQFPPVAAQFAPTDVTVYSWELPEGYDYTAETADPMEDCIRYANRVHFTLENSQPEERQVSDSGEFRPGAVQFGQLHPGEYTLDALDDGEAPDDQILWECFGLDAGAARSVAVNDHHNLAFSLKGGENIMCHRFHIPHGQQSRR